MTQPHPIAEKLTTHYAPRIRETFTIPGTDILVYQRMLTADERERWEESIGPQTGAGGLPKSRQAGVRASLVWHCTEDETGAKIWPSPKEVANLPATLVCPLFDNAARINAIGTNAHEELVGNSEAGNPGN